MCVYVCVCVCGGGGGGYLLPDFHGTLIVRLEEVIGAVVLDCLPAVLSHIKDCNAKTSREREHVVVDVETGFDTSRVKTLWATVPLCSLLSY